MPVQQKEIGRKNFARRSGRWWHEALRGRELLP
jgi:hypothetical protein